MGCRRVSHSEAILSKMPLYDFQCEKCGAEFEVERALSATGPEKCPQCGSTKTAKVFSAAGIVFKGSGFYVTDSKSPPASGGGSKPESKPEGKPASADSGGTAEGGGSPTSSEAPKAKNKE
jgi:putative FmdB family regulatory protein